MGVYDEQVLPRFLDRALATDDIMEWRRRCVAGLSGVVIEPGFGSGLNIGLYPREVTKVYAVDPSTVGRKLATDRVEMSPVEIEFVGIDGQAIPLGDSTCDGGLVTFTLCTIPDPVQALSELHRVIRPGGALHFLEHGHAPDVSVQKWQRRLEPLQRRLFAGCHLTRNARALIEAAGFRIRDVDAEYAKGPKPFVWYTVGSATRA